MATTMGFKYASFFAGKKRAFKSKGNNRGITIKKQPPPLISGTIHDYECLERISSGAYGTVYRARDIMTGEIVAVKKEAEGISKSTIAEVNILRALKHPRIVDFKNVVMDDNDGVIDVYVVMEYLEYDLCEYMKETATFTLSEIKRLMRELLEGVSFIHWNGVMHRDLKPSNVLVNANRDLKICDFGMSRPFPNEWNPVCTPIVCTLWYRAPELLLGSCTSYSGAIDMWSVGCIMAEFFLKRVLFSGDSEIQQLGVINNTILNQSCDQLYDKFDAARSEKGGPVLTEKGFDLLCRLLAYDPQNRISAQDALDHEWFDESNLDYHIFV
ncbi:hypothetical protein CASFOL_007251 [Castilleja foliolosa]|uniref:Protein kinase domain-containing protein n=1 Tax=Castilleja foliolosa TaxID=1961234 RepID=A0ABD3E8Q5_9LAMI